MAIQPIDLSVVYSQMDNVAKFNASQNQLVQSANQQGRDRTAEQNLERSKTVQEAAKQDVSSTTIKNDLQEGGAGSGPQGSGGRKKRRTGAEEEDAAPPQEFTDPCLGNRIDIIG